ncbi:MAG: hypothetical protein HY247_00750 [archaeon]|nr:MAG: hypothetical protein HY247_00750 [archaeon]
MKIEKASDLIYWTYYMIDWAKVEQSSSDQKCSECGDAMMRSEPAVDSSGRKYDGYVCHKDKRVIWVRAA